MTQDTALFTVAKRFLPRVCPHNVLIVFNSSSYLKSGNMMCDVCMCGGRK